MNFRINRSTHKTKAGRVAAFALAVALCGCQNPGQTAAKLQGHIASAKTSSAQTGQHITNVGGKLDTIDYKASRAQKLLDQGVPQ